MGAIASVLHVPTLCSVSKKAQMIVKLSALCFSFSTLEIFDKLSFDTETKMRVPICARHAVD